MVLRADPKRRNFVEMTLDLKVEIDVDMSTSNQRRLQRNFNVDFALHTRWIDVETRRRNCAEMTLDLKVEIDVDMSTSNQRRIQRNFNRWFDTIQFLNNSVNWQTDRHGWKHTLSGLELAGGRGPGMSPHWVSLSSLLFVFLASPRGTENVPGTAGSQCLADK